MRYIVAPSFAPGTPVRVDYVDGGSFTGTIIAREQVHARGPLGSGSCQRWYDLEGPHGRRGTYPRTVRWHTA